MPARREPRSNTAPQPRTGSPATAPIARVFTPAELDLDDLAEAIRVLLEFDGAHDSDAASAANPDLLSMPRRVSHVVGATEEP